MGILYFHQFRIHIFRYYIHVTKALMFTQRPANDLEIVSNLIKTTLANPFFVLLLNKLTNIWPLMIDKKKLFIDQIHTEYIKICCC